MVPDLKVNQKQHIAALYALGDIVDSGKGGIVSEDMVPGNIAPF